MTSADRWYALPVLSGHLIRLEPLAVEHVPGYLAAAGTAHDAVEVFRWMQPAPPHTVADAERDILIALAARARGERFAYAQVDAQR